MYMWKGLWQEWLFREWVWGNGYKETKGGISKQNSDFLKPILSEWFSLLSHGFVYACFGFCCSSVFTPVLSMACCLIVFIRLLFSLSFYTMLSVYCHLFP